MAMRFTYKESGVDQEAADRFAGNIRAYMRRTFRPEVIDNPSGYAGLFGIDGSAWLLGRQLRAPVLVASTDGVGTKLKLAFMADKHDTVGIDLVAMCVNDVICQAAKPLLFLDYIATGKLKAEQLEAVVRGIAKGCEQADCSLIGGETAQMPDFYPEGEYDMAGFALGVAERRRVLDGTRARPGCVAVGLASDGLHSNGYSLVRRLLFDHAKMSMTDHVAELGCTLAEELLRPTRIYVHPLQALHAVYEVKHIPCGIAHITGGGIPGNVPRVVPEGCSVRIKRGSWPVPPIFDLLQKVGDLEDEEMFGTFNMGLGLVLLVPPFYVDAVIRRLGELGERAYVVGDVRRGKRGVRIVR